MAPEAYIAKVESVPPGVEHCAVQAKNACTRGVRGSRDQHGQSLVHSRAISFHTAYNELLARRPDLVGNSTPPGGWRGPVLLPHFSPEDGRQHGQPGADPGNHGPTVHPRSKLPEEP